MSERTEPCPRCELPVTLTYASRVYFRDGVFVEWIGTCPACWTRVELRLTKVEPPPSRPAP